MFDKVIPLADHRYRATLPRIPPEATAPRGELRDTLDRPLRDLRISVTDRCNFRCSYCMPKEVFDRDYAFLPQTSLLTFEEIVRGARLFVAHGVQKIRLTGGEPLLRRHVEQLVNMLTALRTPARGALDLTLTTNGSLLAKKARVLKEAGLGRVTVSLDAIDDAVFRRMNDADFPVSSVLKGIDEAMQAGFSEIKVNMVVKRGVNESEIVPMARHFRGTPVALRFIEYMDVGATNGWRMDDVMPSDEVRALIETEWPLEAAPRRSEGETAARWRYRDGGGEIGFISSVTNAFCGDCNRARLSTEGKLFLCLFANRGHDLRALLRSNASDADISGAIGLIWSDRNDRYSELRGANLPVDTSRAPEHRVEMHYIGG